MALTPTAPDSTAPDSTAPNWYAHQFLGHPQARDLAAASSDPPPGPLLPTPPTQTLPALLPPELPVPVVTIRNELVEIRCAVDLALFEGVDVEVVGQHLVVRAVGVVPLSHAVPLPTDVHLRGMVVRVGAGGVRVLLPRKGARSGQWWKTFLGT